MDDQTHYGFSCQMSRLVPETFWQLLTSAFRQSFVVEVAIGTSQSMKVES